MSGRTGKSAANEMCPFPFTHGTNEPQNRKHVTNEFALLFPSCIGKDVMHHHLSNNTENTPNHHQAQHRKRYTGLQGNLIGRGQY